MVYSTCSIEPAENQERVAQFLEQHSDFEKVKEEVKLPGDGCADGAYAALLRKK